MCAWPNPRSLISLAATPKARRLSSTTPIDVYSGIPPPRSPGSQFQGGDLAYLAGPHVAVLARQQQVERDVVHLGVAVVRLAVGEGHLCRLNPRVQVLRRVVSVALDVEFPKNGKLLQEHRSLRPR